MKAYFKTNNLIGLDICKEYPNCDCKGHMTYIENDNQSHQQLGENSQSKILPSRDQELLHNNSSSPKIVSDGDSRMGLDT